MHFPFKLARLYPIALIGSWPLALSASPRPESWHSAPDKSTTKVRLITHMDKNALQYQLIQRVLERGLRIDTTSSWPGHLWSTVGTSENYYVHFLVETTDSVATISSQLGNLGLNAVMASQPPSADNIAWWAITWNEKGWLDLTIIARVDSAVIQYNSTQ